MKAFQGKKWVWILLTAALIAATAAVLVLWTGPPAAQRAVPAEAERPDGQGQETHPATRPETETGTNAGAVTAAPQPEPPPLQSGGENGLSKGQADLPGGPAGQETDGPPEDGGGNQEVVLGIGAPRTVSKDEGEFGVGVNLSSLPPGVYPAASLELAFDPNKLELIGAEPGTAEASGEPNAGGNPRPTIPEWKCDAQASNKTGVARLMYVDMTGEKNAYCGGRAMPETKNAVVRLVFRLRDAAQAGDRLTLTFGDVVFAETNGNSLTGETMRLKDGEILVTS